LDLTKARASSYYITRKARIPSLLEKLMDKIKLDPETSALILIDLQHGIVALETSPHPASSVVAKAASLAATFRKYSSPVIYVRVDLANMLQVPADRSHGDPKNPPPAIASELVPASGVQPGDLVVTKRHWSAFSGTDLEERLQRAGVKTVVIGGITTNYGVESTARVSAAQKPASSHCPCPLLLLSPLSLADG
jgi:nicotinamidase-related amidase